ncbi:hypothetical protein C8A05DRAFT_37709 [Staphylotrichum tortipilum]|uniref:Uncharacterized protein n=1 Tax=Staphylotrichum tortipilum TaxID=2831512 RepID=A0AAN6MEN5_9PEZI|nr:hypothetical protein C8A05DRAFT_37709 [Staphylotrichum longicolle]
MGLVKALPLLSLTLSALCGTALAGEGSNVALRQVLDNPEGGFCVDEGWNPTCDGDAPCVEAGEGCCTDETSYEPFPDSCADETDAGAEPRSDDDGPYGSNPYAGNPSDAYGSPDSMGGGGGSFAPGQAATPLPYHAPSAELVGSSSHLYTFVMTYHLASHFTTYEHSLPVVVSTQVESCATVTVSATDAAQASVHLSSYTATALLPVPTPHSPPPAATGPVVGKPVGNETVPTGTRGHGPVVTAGAARVGAVGAAVAGLVLGLAAMMV